MKRSARIICEMTGFSPATVSNVLNNKGGYTEKTRQAILSAAEEIGYEKKSRTDNAELAFVIYQKSGRIVGQTDFFIPLFSAISSECEKYQYDLSVLNLDHRSSSFQETLDKILKKYENILFLGTEMDNSLADALAERNQRIVILDNWVDNMGIDVVALNNTKSAVAATQHLIEAGHKKIGYLKSKYRINNFRHRASGYLMAMSNYSLEIPPKSTILLEPNINDAYQDMKKYLKRNRLTVTAFFADNDAIAIGAIKAMKESGYRVPDDISVVGFDDIPYDLAMTPTLTTISVHKENYGKAAVHRIMGMTEGRISNVHVLVNTELVVRESVKKFHGDTWLKNNGQY